MLRATTRRPSEQYRRLRQEMLHAERRVVLEARDSGKVDDEVLRDVLNLLDAEESLLDRLEDKGSDGRARARRADRPGRGLRPPQERAGVACARTLPRAARSACGTAPAGCTSGSA